jgi:AcrR family transcriptional regulator
MATTKERLNTAALVAGAITLVNERGPEALSLAELAARFRVRPPSLYNHVDGLPGLKRELTLEALRRMTVLLRRETAGRAGLDALFAMAMAYRRFAAEEPGLYAFILPSTEQADPEVQSAGNELLEVVLAALRAYRLEGDAALHAVRCVRSVLHGFVSLELAGGFGLPLDLNETFALLLALLDIGLQGMGQSANG